MILHGREIKFRYSVGASLELKKTRFKDTVTEADLDKKYENNEEEAFKDIVAMLLVLNKAAVINEEFESGKQMKDFDYSKMLTEEEIYNCTEDELEQLIAEMQKSKSSDEETSVEVEEDKKKEAPPVN